MPASEPPAVPGQRREISIGNTGTLQYTGSTTVNCDRIWYFVGGGVFEVTDASGSLTLTGSSNLNGNNATITKTGPGTLTLTYASTGLTNSSVVLSGGTLVATGGNGGVFGAGSCTLTLNGGTKLDLDFASGTSSSKLNMGRPTTVGASMTIVSDTASTGGGSGNTYLLGPLAIGGSTLSVTGGNVNSGTAGLSFGATTLSGASTFSITKPTGGGTTLLTLGAMTNNGNTATLTGNGNFAQTGAASGSGGLTLDATYSGTATLSQANLYSGTTTVNGGTLNLSGAFTNTLASSPTIHVASGALLDVTGLTGSTLTLAAGQSLNGNGSVTGSLNGGTTGKVSPGASTGVLRVSGDAYLASGSLAIDIDDTQSPMCGKLAVTGTLDITGATLDLTAFGAPGQTAYVIATYGTLSPAGGPFAHITGMPGGYMIDYAYDGGNQIAIKPGGSNWSVTFQTNGGSPVPPSQSVAGGGTATQPADPTQTNYVFAGWYGDAALTTGFNFATPITANTTLYAKWKTLYANWADGALPSGKSLTDANPARDFDGGGLPTGIEWVTGSDPTNPADDASHTPTFNTTSDPSNFLFIFRRTAAAGADANTTIAVEYGSGLSGWRNSLDNGAADGVTTSVVHDGFATGVDKVTVAIPRTLAPTHKLFARLKVVVAAP